MKQHGYRCFLCGADGTKVELHIGHLISRNDAQQHGVYDDLVDHVANLAPMCSDCNYGLRYDSVDVLLLAKALHLRKVKPT
jgi:5-methylcytosine-specific restriction endonuclease McrA